MAPGAVEFQIHQVVPAFQINMLRRAKRKNFMRLSSCSAMYRSGTQAIKISGVKAETGQAKTNNSPEMQLNKRDEGFFKKKGLNTGGKFGKKRGKGKHSAAGIRI